MRARSRPLRTTRRFAQQPIGCNHTLTFDADRAARFKKIRIAQAIARLCHHLDATHATMIFHPAGGVHGGIPHIVKHLLRADYSSDHCPGMEPNAHLNRLAVARDNRSVAASISNTISAAD